MSSVKRFVLRHDYLVERRMWCHNPMGSFSEWQFSQLVTERSSNNTVKQTRLHDFFNRASCGIACDNLILCPTPSKCFCSVSEKLEAPCCLPAAAMIQYDAQVAVPSPDPRAHRFFYGAIR